MNKESKNYPEGTWFAVPLRDGGFARGLIARTNGEGIMFGYFFEPRLDGPQCGPKVSYLRPNDAILVGQFGDLGLQEGVWTVIDRTDDWKREDWPLPPFVRLDEIEGKAWKVMYSDDLNEVSIDECQPSLINEHPRDILMGAGSVEIRLTKLLS